MYTFIFKVALLLVGGFALGAAVKYWADTKKFLAVAIFFSLASSCWAQDTYPTVEESSVIIVRLLATLVGIQLSRSTVQQIKFTT